MCPDKNGEPPKLMEFSQSPNTRQNIPLSYWFDASGMGEIVPELDTRQLLNFGHDQRPQSWRRHPQRIGQIQKVTRKYPILEPTPLSRLCFKAILEARLDVLNRCSPRGGQPGFQFDLAMSAIGLGCVRAFGCRISSSCSRVSSFLAKMRSKTLAFVAKAS